MSIFGIRDSRLNDPLRNKEDFQTPEYMINDTEESLAPHQVKRIFNRPLETSDPSHKKFTSWRGRLVCAIKFCQSLVREPFRMLKNVLVIVKLAIVLLLNLLNLPFSQNAREEILGAFFATFSSITGALLRPLTFASDLLKLGAGAMIHPTLAIYTEKD